MSMIWTVLKKREVKKFLIAPVFSEAALILLNSKDMEKKIISLFEYKEKKSSEKNLTWLYSLSEFALISEFIESHAELETTSATTYSKGVSSTSNPPLSETSRFESDYVKKAEWLDTVSEVISVRFFKNKTQKT